jgi:geranylgeranyl pyrophosphate synthase
MIKIDTSFDLDLPYQVKMSMRRASARLRSLGTRDFINPQLSAAAMHLVSARSKYIRSALVFISASAIGKKPSDFIDLAAAIELLHTASLVHDDIIDRDAVRRGRPAVHMKYGIEAAILAGDALISKSILLSSKYGPAVIDEISHAAMSMCAGEILDFQFQRSRKVPKVSDYMNVATLKSASLIGTAASVSAVCAKSPGLASKLYEFGKYAGIAFQMRDDILNFMGLSDSSRKSTGNDTAKFRPNIVQVMLKADGGKDDALRRAIGLNNSLIDTANMQLHGEAIAPKLSGYADLIRIRYI